MNNSLDYIEENSASDLSYEKAAQIACCSVNYYQRMFSFISNTTLAEYIRRRRLTKAAFELQNSSNKVLDISIRYGYNSPTAFTRAFTSVHGVTPTEARKLGTALKLYPSYKYIVVKCSQENYGYIFDNMINGYMPEHKYDLLEYKFKNGW
ncbi:MAG: AraC family transcriptional regulator [Mobilitalea sp.]